MCQKKKINNFLPYQKKQKFPKNVTFETEIMPKINTYIFNIVLIAKKIALFLQFLAHCK